MNCGLAWSFLHAGREGLDPAPGAARLRARTSARRREILEMRNWMAVLLLLLVLPASAKSSFSPIGPTLTNGKTTVSCWLVTGEPLGPSVAVKLRDAQSEANVCMTAAQLEELKSYCQTAFAYREPMEDGQKVVIGGIVTRFSRLEVVVARGKGVTAVYLAGNEGKNKPAFVLTAPQRENFYNLLDQAKAALSS